MGSPHDPYDQFHSQYGGSSPVTLSDPRVRAVSGERYLGLFAGLINFDNAAIQPFLPEQEGFAEGGSARLFAVFPDEEDLPENGRAEVLGMASIGRLPPIEGLGDPVELRPDAWAVRFAAIDLNAEVDEDADDAEPVYAMGAVVVDALRDANANSFYTLVTYDSSQIRYLGRKARLVATVKIRGFAAEYSLLEVTFDRADPDQPEGQYERKADPETDRLLVGPMSVT